MRSGDEGKWLAVCSASACLVAVPPLWPGVREAMTNVANPGISSTFVCVCSSGAWTEPCRHWLKTIVPGWRVVS